MTTLDVSYVVTVKSTVESLQNFVIFSEYMNFTGLFIRSDISLQEYFHILKYLSFHQTGPTLCTRTI